MVVEHELKTPIMFVYAQLILFVSYRTSKVSHAVSYIKKDILFSACFLFVCLFVIANKENTGRQAAAIVPGLL